jgi:transcriptional regulator of aromatic amino acid metabolism
MQLIESSLLLFAQPWQPAWNEVKEQDLLIILLSTVKANGMNEAVRLHLEDNMQRFEPQIPEQSFQHYPTSGSDVQNSVSVNSNTIQITAMLTP